MMKKITSMLLALAMCLALCACGSKPSAPAPQTPAATDTPEYVYVARYEPVADNSEFYINPRISTPDGYYLTSYERIGEEIPEGVTPEYEDQYAIYGPRLYFLGKDGNLTLLENFNGIEGAKNDGNYSEFYSASDLAGIMLDNEGKLVTIEMVYTSWYEGPDSIELYSDDYWNYMRYEQIYYLRRLDTDGSELSRAELPSGENEYFNVHSMKMDPDNNVVFISDSTVCAFSLDGSEAYSIEADNYIDGLVTLADGRLGAIIWDDNGVNVMLIDTENRCFGECYSVPSDSYNCFTGTGEYDLFYTTGSNFFGLDLETGRSDKLFNWINCNVNPSRANNITVEEDGSLVCFSNEWDPDTQTYRCERVVISRQPADSVPKRETIRMAVMYSDYNTMNAVISFNRANDSYCIELDDYSQYNNEEDGWDAGLTKLKTEIMAGNLPDIFLLNGLNYTQLASKGLLQDLYPYIDADPELSRDDFFPNILAALEVDGKLCCTLPNFYITTVIGASSVVGDTPGWTYAELEEALAGMPEGCTVFDEYVTRADILSTCLALDMNNFVDWSTGKCSFDSPQFIDLLKFVKTFPSEFDWENYRGDGMSPADRVAQGKQMCRQVSVFSIEDLIYGDYIRAFGDDITFIGFPTNNGVGNMLGFSESALAISAKCPYKDAAWQFLRTFFTEKYQRNIWSLPSNRKLFEQKLANACKIEYKKDTNDNYLLDDSGEKIPVVKYYTWDELENKDVPVYCMSEETADTLRALVSGTTKLENYDDSILSIVSEQVQAYFEGQRSAEDVAKLIQSKVNIFVNEQR